MSYTVNTMNSACIDNCSECHQICWQMAMTHCLTLGGEHVKPEHFRLMLDCAKICETSACFQLSGSPFSHQICKICAEICTECANSCEAVGAMEECVAACRKCADSCRSMAA